MQIIEFIDRVSVKSVINQIEEALAFTEKVKRNDFEDRKSLPKLINYIHGLRYKMAYNKATDSGLNDSKLKRAWNELKELDCLNKRIT
jgi:asparagine synthetase A